MRTWLGLWRAVIHRSRADWPVVAAAWVLLLCAISLLVAGVVYSETVATAGLRQELRAAAPQTGRSSFALPHRRPRRRSSTPTSVASSPRSSRRRAGCSPRSCRPARTPTPSTAANEVKDLVTVAAYEDIEHHAALVAGVWPVAGQTPLQVSTSAACRPRRSGWRSAIPSPWSAGPVRRSTSTRSWWPPGSRRPGTPTGSTTRSRSTGRSPARRSRPMARSSRPRPTSWRCPASGPSIWSGGRSRPSRVSGSTTPMPSRPTSTTSTTGSRRYLPTGSASQIETGLPAILVVLSRAILVSRSEVFLLTAQFAILAGYAIILVAGLLVDRRRGETALLRSRGAGRTQVGGMALVESLLIAVPGDPARAAAGRRRRPDHRWPRPARDDRHRGGGQHRCADLRHRCAGRPARRPRTHHPGRRVRRLARARRRLPPVVNRVGRWPAGPASTSPCSSSPASPSGSSASTARR